MTDSYSLEEVNAKIAPKYMEILLEAYELQQAKREQEAQKNEEIK